MYTLLRYGLTLAGFAAGVWLGYSGLIPFINIYQLNLSPTQATALLGLPGLAGAVLGYFLPPRIVSWTIAARKLLEDRVRTTPLPDFLLGTAGVIIGLVVANLLSPALVRLPLAGGFLPVAASLVFAYLGWAVMTSNKAEIGAFWEIIWSFVRMDRSATNRETSDQDEQDRARPKILDTSVIIDGRIVEILETGFLEGTVVIPSVVLEELQHIADSADGLRRNRGRHGLDMLNRIQGELDTQVKIWDDPISDQPMEVDRQLIELAMQLDGAVVTNDYNLNKVARFQQVPVLNINELANAVKPVVLPGESMQVQVIKDGKEPGQGVGYLDDGTMIVVEGGKEYMGRVIDISVTSVLQTSAGRMIFAKPQEAQDATG